MESTILFEKNNNLQRRKFLQTIASSVAIVSLSQMPYLSYALQTKENQESLTIQQVIDLILKSIPGAPFKTTVDTIKSGDASQKVTGIVTTMFATVEVIEKTAALGANFIIAHEPSFYNHADETQWLANDAVYKYKSDLLVKHKIVVWRMHDYLHAHKPDGVLTGVIEKMGWQVYTDNKKPWLIKMPSTNFGDIIQLAKTKLGIQHLRYIGNKEQLCSNILLIPGAAGGRMQINALMNEKPDLLIVGELSEWETSEYIRDLRASGKQTALLVLGHVVSEEPGMEWLANWLQPQLKNIAIQHIPSKDAFTWD